MVSIGFLGHDFVRVVVLYSLWYHHSVFFGMEDAVDFVVEMMYFQRPRLA